MIVNRKFEVAGAYSGEELLRRCEEDLKDYAVTKANALGYNLMKTHGVSLSEIATLLTVARNDEQE